MAELLSETFLHLIAQFFRNLLVYRVIFYCCVQK